MMHLELAEDLLERMGTGGQLAKTDRIDTATLALFAERVRPEPRPLPDEAARTLDGLLARRRQVLDMLVTERNRLTHASRPFGAT